MFLFKLEIRNKVYKFVGPEEDIPRSLDCMEFIMHAPSDYFKSKSTPYPIINAPAQPGYIWTSIDTVKNLCKPE